MHRLASLLLIGLGLWTAPVRAQDAPAPPIRVIIEVPNDEAGRAFVKDRLAPILPPTATVSTAAAGAPAPPRDAMSERMATRLEGVRARAMSLIAAAPSVPGDIRMAARSFDVLDNRGDVIWLIAAAALFVGGGFAAQRLAWWGSRGLLTYMMEAPSETVVMRLKIHAARAGMGVLMLCAFLVGSLGAFLLFPWPPVFREIVLVLLGSALAMRLSVALGRVVIAPGARHLYFRMLPLSTPLAWFWYRWLVWTTALVMSGVAILAILRIIGMPEASRGVVEAGWLTLVAIALLVMIWRRQHFPDARQMSRIVALGLSFVVVLAWLVGSLGMPAYFITLVVGAALPLLISVINDGVRHVGRIDDPQIAPDQGVLGWAVVMERTLRALLVVGAVVIVARAWDIDLGAIAAGETMLTATVRAGLRIVIVLLAADVAWKLVRTLIDSKISPVRVVGEDHVHDDSPEAKRRQRLDTLLPILRNVLLIFIIGIALLMALDALGVQIGPLLAGAGVVGIAIGFGAQTLVKDIISGIFYLLDDAFRVGEYIQASSHKGTVESFSLRSVKLRHHRGPITTVPFGDLGAVQNQSRDWVIDKVTIGVPYDTDLDKVRKLVKQVGQDLQADPEIAPNLIETLKMQGVEQMGEFAVQIRLKMMTKPGEQFVARRRAYALLKKAFEASGIKFAVPTVQVSGGRGDAVAGAAAQHGLALAAPKAPEGAGD